MSDFGLLPHVRKEEFVLAIRARFSEATEEELVTPSVFDMSTAADADDEAVDAAASSVGALHMKPFSSSGGGGVSLYDIQFV